jgi:hypothetical protein
MSDSFFEKYISNPNVGIIVLNWYSLCQNTNISEAFFERNLKDVNWDSLCKNNNISEAFFEKYIHHPNREIKLGYFMSKY